MITFFGATTKGTVREKNEDAYIICTAKDKRAYLFAVADGIGGLNAGEVASHTAIKMLEEAFFSQDFTKMSFEDIDKELLKISKNINSELLGISVSDKSKKGLGTTLSVMMILDNRAVISHVGDSSIFRIGKELMKLTEDHTFVNELLKKNEISIDEALNHPKRNLITKALGCEFDFEMESHEIEIAENEIYILCTDGLFSNRKNEAEVIDKDLLITKSAEEITSYLIDYANNEGGKDNTTIITIKT